MRYLRGGQEPREEVVAAFAITHMLSSWKHGPSTFSGALGFTEGPESLERRKMGEEVTMGGMTDEEKEKGFPE